MTGCHEFPQVLKHDSVKIVAKKVSIANTHARKAVPPQRVVRTD